MLLLPKLILPQLTKHKQQEIDNNNKTFKLRQTI